MKVGTAKAAAELLAPLFEASEQEIVAVAHLDAGQRLLEVSVEEKGAGGEVALPVRAILTRALKLDAHAIIVAHNHPSGDPTPSEADREATRRLAEAAAAVDVRLHDHLIFAGGECRSFRALGLL